MAAAPSSARLAAAAAAAAAALASAPVVFLLSPDDASWVAWPSRVIANRVSMVQREQWMAGDARPNRIILVRHGQTHGYSHTCSCQVEGLPVCALKPEMERPLTEEGKLQALKAGVELRKFIGDETVSFFVSPYRSCKQTFQFLSGSFSERGVSYTEDPRLRNQYFGDWRLVEKPAASDPAKKSAIAEDIKKIGLFYYVFPQGGEAASDVYDRVSSFMESLYRKWAQPKAAQNYVLITHNIVIMAFCMRWFHWDVATFHRLGKMQGGQLAVMEKQADGSYALVTPLPCDPPVPLGVRQIAGGPSDR